MSVSVTQLTPLRFLERSAEVFPDKTAIVDGARRLTYREFAREATRVARALQATGVERGDRVAYLCMNSTELLVAHFAVPLAGAVLVAINTRLAPDEVAYICDHSGARLLMVDAELRRPLDAVAAQLRTVREVVTVADGPGGGNGRGRPTPTCSTAARTSRCHGRCPTSWTRLPSITPRAPPASPRASSTPTAAPTSTRSAR